MITTPSLLPTKTDIHLKAKYHNDRLTTDLGGQAHGSL